MTDAGRPQRLDPIVDSPTRARRRALRALVPEAFVDGVLDLDALARALGEDRPERGGYGLVWPGKAEAQAAVESSGAAALIPDVDSSVAFDTARHAVIEGDNLAVLQLLQPAYAGAVKLIYIDPPYNTGKEFIYPDNFRDSLRAYLAQTGQGDADGRKTTSATDAGGRYHRRWLSMMYPRLALARRLLRPDGLIAVSIDDHEVHNLRLLMDEIFGPRNFVAQLIWKKKSGGGGDVDLIVTDHEYVLLYSRGPGATVFGDRDAKVTTAYTHTDEQTGRRYSLERLDKASLGYAESLDFEIRGPDGVVYSVQHADEEHKVRRWRWATSTVRDRYDELVFTKGNVYTKNFEKPSAKPRSLLVDERFGRTRTGKKDLKDLFGIEVHDFPKPVRLLAWLVAITTQEDDLVLDFFAGSGSTGDAVLEANRKDGGRRRFVLVQLPHPTKPGSHAHKKGLLTIAATCRARVGAALVARDCDDGFRAFRLGPSSIRSWSAEPGADAAALQAELLAAVNPVVDGAEPLAVGFELASRLRVPLHATFEPVPSLGDRSWLADGVLICLESTFEAAMIDAALACSPAQIVALDQAFAGRDDVLLNLSARRLEAGVDGFFTV
jgi:adenine-specific DNA-methyltransferase